MVWFGAGRIQGLACWESAGLALFLAYFRRVEVEERPFLVFDFPNQKRERDRLANKSFLLKHGQQDGSISL